ncbi:MAG TPA: FAD-binding and (Fe-S)-binding domain-containing protein [Candidatus Polarisedimenticolaceae bacterium]|nr:FAD-binding and (Fe-S)-binding domain-containing protein [Candidatus Polarisedimenticolaceae bacterium]
MRSELSAMLEPGRVLTRLIDRVAYANDASVYRLVPQAVVFPRSLDEVRQLFAFSHRRGIPLTFRSAGTSLSGQAVSDGLLVVLSRHWDAIEVREHGRAVWVQPGVLGGTVNRHLEPYGTKIGPDPASINACMMGGILANNSSGMCCGVERNAYHTLQSIHFLLPDGVEIDSAAPDADERLRRESPALADGLVELSRRVRRDSALAARIRAKYEMKNTNGYSLNALLDHDSAVEILSHLMIGSEGTLGFIADAALRTVPDHALKYTGLLLFRGVEQACAAIDELRRSGAEALELMDRASLRSIEHEPGVPPAIRGLPPGAAALLVEYQCGSRAELDERREACRRVLERLSLLRPAELSTDPVPRAALWRVRKGLIPSVGAMRRRGTSFILEDIVFPVPQLARGVADLRALFERFAYDDAIVFGHAKDGNLHFVLVQAFDDPRDVERYDAFMHALAEVVVGRYDGALKAEHGTGRNMAPFVEAEWGTDAYRVMREIKRLVDPRGLLNPGVLLNDDPRAHIRHLKTLATVEAEVDRCIECGFCERMCPSRTLTLTPRQRIVVRREMARLRAEADRSAELAELERDFVYDALDTCAADGLCALACPVAIDTGALVKRLRAEAHSPLAQRLAALGALRLAWVERLVRAALSAVRLARRDLPRPSRGLPRTRAGGATAVYFPSCVTRVVESSATRLVAVAARAGRPVRIPGDVAGTCCGMPFSSKGYRRAQALAVNRCVERMWRWSGGGELPIVLDTSPCALTLKSCEPELDATNRERFAALEILDGVEFAERLLAAGLRPTRPKPSVVLHPVCSLSKMGLVERWAAVVAPFAERVEIPIDSGCCGFAGDRGYRVPELTAAATAVEAREVNRARHDGYYSTSRTCEIGLTRATGRSYDSFWRLLDEATV